MEGNPSQDVWSCLTLSCGSRTRTHASVQLNNKSMCTSRPDVSGIEPVLFGCVFSELILANRVCLVWLCYLCIINIWINEMHSVIIFFMSLLIIFLFFFLFHIILTLTVKYNASADNLIRFTGKTLPYFVRARFNIMPWGNHAMRKQNPS